ncbi:hypothetical protein [Hippea alviniae]|uniref:hypothetical protein n=1 Tax=Hippea alviniae TaxID=1279027 RepID=UPI0003B3EEDA|nr:hypothetical protein [Hippea alviniae]
MRKIKIEIKNKELLIKIFKTISWLDTLRWSVEDNYNFINFFKNDLTNYEKVLTHWICYITDRQMSFEIVWDKGGYVFSELVYEYSRNKNKSPEEILKEHYEKYRDKKGKERFRFKSNTNNVTFASRYVTNDYQNIFQTLEVLDNYKATIGGNEYKRNLVAFILHFIQRFKGKDDLLVRVACALHLLTYDLESKRANPGRILEILSSKKEFEEKLKEFKRTSTYGKKRLWCCIRDYKKGLYNKIFNNAIKELASDDNHANKLSDIWNNLPMDQIELPGDVWNNSPLFRDNLFADVLDLNSIPKTWGMPRIVREIYNQLKNNKEDIGDFYPEKFDITFDFVPRMCNKKLCNVCLFGKNGADSICIPTKDKYCPVALLSCGYIAECKEENCIVKESISREICKGGLKRFS